MLAAIDAFFSAHFDPAGYRKLGVTKARMQKLIGTGQACFCTYYGIETEKITKEDNKVTRLYKRKINLVIESCHDLDMAILSGLYVNRPYNHHEADIIWFAMALRFCSGEPS